MKCNQDAGSKFEEKMSHCNSQEHDSFLSELDQSSNRVVKTQH